MSENIEDQIVSMQFDNKQFESGVSTSLGTMDKLRSSLNFPDAGKGLSDVNTAVSRFNMNPMASAIQGVSKMWLGLTTVALTAVSNITNKVVDMGLNLAKSFTIDPITQGFSEYEKNLNSTQTIMANTGANVKVVGGYLNDLNHYSDQTIYNFGQMADSIGKFTAAGVKLPDATSSIKGMANSAALAGSDVNQLNTAMYQMSQALSTGVIRLMDWNSLANAGMGGANMRNSLMATAKTLGDHGAAMEDAIKSNGSFRDSLQAGWLTADIFNKSMKVMAGTTNKAGKTVAFSVKQLQGMGYSLKAAKDLNRLSAAAIDSATKVKTFTQLIDVVKESIGSGWSKIFQDLFGDFGQASKLWTSVSNTITGQVGKIFGAIDKALVGWRKLGGFEDLWATVGNIFKIIGNLIHPVIVLFGALLPSTGKAGTGLAKVTSALATFTGWLVKVTDPIGNMTLNLNFLHKGFKLVTSVVGAFVSALQPLLPILSQIGSQISDLFNQGMAIAGNLIAGWTAGLDPAALKTAAVDLANSWIQWIKDALGIHSPASTMIPIGENIIMGIAEGLIGAGKLLITALQQVFLGMGKALKWAVENISYDDVLNTINSGLFLGLVVLFKRFVTAFQGTIGSFQQTMGKAGGVLDQFKNNLKSMQTEVRAKAIMEIALAVGILAASAYLLSTLDTKKLGTALAAIGGLMITLVGAMKVLVGGGGKKVPDAKTIAKQTGQIVAISGAMVAFATAVLILSGAVAIMGQLDPKTMQQGLEGVAAVIAVIVAATAILGKTGGGATIFATASAMIVLAFALTAFVGVMKLYEKLDMKTIADGGGKAALVIAAIGLAMRSFGKGSLTGALGMIAAAAALRIMAGALVTLSALKWDNLRHATEVLAILLLTLGLASKAMTPASAVSLIVMAAALVVMAKALQILAAIPFWDLVKGLGAITVAILLIAGTSAALSELSPLILALGISLLAVGGALFLAGAGVFLFASGLALIAVVGPAAFAALGDGIDELLKYLPKIGEAIGGFVVSMVTGFVKAAGPLAKALGKLIGILIDELTKLIPKAKHLIQALINAILDIIVHSYGHAAKVIIGFVLVLLQRLDNAVPKLIDRGTKLIIALITGLSKNAVKIANATGRAILSFLTGLDKAIVKYEPKIIAAGLKIGRDLISGAVQGLRDAAPDLMGAVENLAHGALDKLKHPWEILSPSKATRRLANYFGAGAALGIRDQHGNVEDSAEEMAHKALNAMKMTFNNSKRAGNSLADISPKVTPVLDLSQLEKDATQIGSALGHHKIQADVSRRTARSIASDELSRHRYAADVADAGDTYNFEQNIYSPKPVDKVRVYRSTKSQLAFHREVTRR